MKNQSINQLLKTINKLNSYNEALIEQQNDQDENQSASQLQVTNKEQSKTSDQNINSINIITSQVNVTIQSSVSSTNDRQVKR